MKQKIHIIALILLILSLQLVSAFQISECNPDQCPTGYTQGPRICANGVCSIQCDYYTACDDNNITVFSESRYLPSYNVSSYSGSQGISFLFGDFIPNATNKCYRFRQTTPTNFVNDSNINFTNLNGHDSSIGLFWKNPWYNITSASAWYDQQNYFSTWSWLSDSIDDTSVWVDSCNDEGDNFNSADNLQFTNYLYCAPNQAACQEFNATYCDTDCYGKSTAFWLDFEADLPNGLSCNNFGSYDQVRDNVIGAEIDFIKFNPQTVDMIIDEFNATLGHSFNNTCNYNPQCNPADPCCDLTGNFRPSGYVCKSAHDVQCTDAASCQGTAYEDRCTSTSASCPDSNNLIDYDAACDDQVCVGQSCSNSTLQPQRTCSAGVCQVNDPYACPNNLNCLGAASCKKSASSSSDCKTGYTFDTTSSICWLNETNSYNLIYDGNGNLISGFGFNYSYDVFNKLANVTASSGGALVAKYLYDQDGERVQKVEFADGTNVTTYYVGDFVQTVNSTGSYNETYYYSNGDLVARKGNNGEFYFLYPDHLGSTVLITNSNGTVLAQQDYDPFGELTGTSSDRHGYTGHELDSETDNIYMKARFYDPTIGKFIQPDNIISEVYNPQDLNRYAYVRNNPYTYIDSTGLFAVTFDVGYGGGLYPVGGAGGLHVGGSYSQEYGLQIGSYASISGGSLKGIGELGVSGGFSVTPNAKRFSDLFGGSATSGGTVAIEYLGASYDKSVSHSDSSIKSYSVAYSPGIALEKHEYETVSYDALFDLGQPKEKNKMDPKSKNSQGHTPQKQTETQKNSGLSSVGTKISEAVKQAGNTIVNTVKSVSKAIFKALTYSIGGKK